MRRGFTLVEILVCVLILGIAAAVIVPSINDRDDLKCAAAARAVMADLAYAQNRAIATQARHYVVFDTTTTPHSYRIVTAVTPLTNITHPVTKASQYFASFGTGGTTGLTDVALHAVSLEGKTTLCFDELGVPYAYDPATNTSTALAVTGGSTVTLKSGKHTVTVSIEPYTGELKTN